MSKHKTTETQFIDWIVSKFPILVKSRITRKGPGENLPHIRFSNGCGLTAKEEFLKLFEDMNFVPMGENDFSKTYKVGGYIRWNGHKIGVLYGVAEKGQIERKRWSPESLGLNGYTSTTVDDFRSKIISGLMAINEPEIDLVVSLLNNVENKQPIVMTEFLKANKSKITSDFGEVLAAYHDVVNGFTVKFSDKSNQKVIDYCVLVNNEWKEVSVKNPKGGGKVNLSDYVNLIDITNQNIHAQILHAIGSHNRDKMFELGAKACPQLKRISEIVGGTTKEHKINYVSHNTYDSFFDQIKSNSLFIFNKEPLGIPNEQEWKPNELTPRSLWAQGSLEPIDFTINTLLSRFWGSTEVEEISRVVAEFLNKPKFKIVDIVDNNVTIKEIEFKDVNKWKTVYWSRATKAWHNWIAVEPVKETK